jgi:hypothetical protein
MKVLIVAAGIVVSGVGILAQDLSRDQINAAIEQGRAGKTALKKCGASGDNGFEIVIEGPTGRIMRAALDAKRHHREFTADTLLGDVSGPWLTVLARRDPTLTTGVDPMPPKPGASFQDPATESLYSTSRLPRNASGDYTYAAEVAIKTKKQGTAQSPTLRPNRPILYSRVATPTNFVWIDGPSSVRPLPGGDLVAWFDLAAFQALPAGDVSVMIFTTDAGERRCTISDKERQRLQ